MREGTRTAVPQEGQPDERFARRALVAAEEASPAHRVRAGLEALIVMAEDDPAAARSTLRQLRTDHRQLAHLEAWLGGDPDRTTFGLGAAIQLADAELSSPDADLHALVEELLPWLEGGW